MRSAILSLLLLTGVAARAGQIPVREIEAPIYPRLAWLASLQGSVTLELEINREGKVRSVKVSGADALLQKESEKNIRQWTFGPFAEGTTFPVRLKVRYTYRFEGEPDDKFLAPRVIITIPDRVEIVARPPKPIID
jgi:TonB family protein